MTRLVARSAGGHARSTGLAVSKIGRRKGPCRWPKAMEAERLDVSCGVEA